jgi:hypothetical protein
MEHMAFGLEEVEKGLELGFGKQIPTRKLFGKTFGVNN